MRPPPIHVSREWTGDSADFPEVPYIVYTRDDLAQAMCFAVNKYYTMESDGLSHFRVFDASGTRRPRVQEPSIEIYSFKDPENMFNTGRVCVLGGWLRWVARSSLSRFSALH